MASRYAIGPSIGVARLGNSTDHFYLEPDKIGGLPIACDSNGNILLQSGKPVSVRQFKDALGRVKRQGAYFRVFEILDDGSDRELTLDAPGVESMTWTVHLANKKACWYQFSGLEGNLLYGAENSYAAKDVALRNPNVTGTDPRRELIIDPGPRTVSGRAQHAPINKATSEGYKFASWPEHVVYGELIDSLGDVLTDNAGRLVVLGGFGKSGGDTSITSFAGANTWHDDIADGPVVCTVTFTDKSVQHLEAWCLVGSPKFAPEVENIVTLDDTMFDTAVRTLGAYPAIFANGTFNAAYAPNFERDIQPILQRPGGYRWVANTPSMNSLSPPPFDPRDKTAATQGLRAAYLALFRIPSPENSIGPDANRLFTTNGFPMMPLNSGSNSVFNQKDLIDKFLTLTETQYFFLKQWAAGHFDTAPPPPTDQVTALTEASVGNCVGGPFCPGIEVTWSTRSPNIYAASRQIRQRHPIAYYDAHGLDPSEDETATPQGCEPGDLTKRMAIPWQADFFQCSIQFINFTDPAQNKSDGGIPTPPTYYAYWWPPQSPWQIVTGDLGIDGQALAGTPAGFQVMFTRGINTFSQMIDYWHYMGFLVNHNTSEYGGHFPYIVEQERNHAAFIAAAVAVGDGSNVITGADQNFSNTWFLPTPIPAPAPNANTAVARAAGGAAQSGHRRAGQAVTFATSRQHGRLES
ncbi:MAG: L-lysine 6-oxidase [Acetobacteraceae bacterium]|nr:L-lysine 6-oxidase [Acetobacteraceae bacterium]